MYYTPISDIDLDVPSAVNEHVIDIRQRLSGFLKENQYYYDTIYPMLYGDYPV